MQVTGPQRKVKSYSRLREPVHAFYYIIAVAMEVSICRTVAVSYNTLGYFLFYQG